MVNMEVPENILVILEIKAKKTGKTLEEVIKEYNQSLERGKKAVEIINLIRSLTGEQEIDILKEVYHTAGLKIPIYKRFTAPYSYKRIKENDTLIFDTNYTSLENGDIYIFKFSFLDRTILLYGEYDKKHKGFIVEVGGRVVRNDEAVEVLGVLKQVERDL